MKNTVIILLAFFTISEASSQENKKWWIGGTIGGAYEKGDPFNFEMTTKTWSLGQEIGMRFGNRFATGINVAFRQYKRESERLVTQEIKRASINTSGFFKVLH